MTKNWQRYEIYRKVRVIYLFACLVIKHPKTITAKPSLLLILTFRALAQTTSKIVQILLVLPVSAPNPLLSLNQRNFSSLKLQLCPATKTNLRKTRRFLSQNSHLSSALHVLLISTRRISSKHQASITKSLHRLKIMLAPKILVFRNYRRPDWVDGDTELIQDNIAMMIWKGL